MILLVGMVAGKQWLRRRQQMSPFPKSYILRLRGRSEKRDLSQLMMMVLEGRVEELFLQFRFKFLSIILFNFQLSVSQVADYKVVKQIQQQIIKQSHMSKSQQQFVHQKGLLSTFSHHSRTKSSKLMQKYSIAEIIAKAKQLYNSNKLAQSLQYLLEVDKYDTNTNPEVNYLIGIMQMAKNNYQEASKYLQKAEQKVKNYKGNTYMLLAICYNKLKVLDRAYNKINEQYADSKSVQCTFYKGRIEMKMQKYDQGIQTMMQVLRMDNKNKKARMYILQCLKKRQMYEKCVEYAINFRQQIEKQGQSEQLKNIKLVQASCYIEINEMDKAKQILNSLQQCPSVLYNKALISGKEGKKNQRILLLNQCLSYQTNQNIFVKTLSDLIIIYMKDKDFYQAFHYANRSNYLKLQSNIIKMLAKQAQGMTFLMKKKFGEAILMIGSITLPTYSHIKVHAHYLNNLYYDSMGYGYFSVGDHKTALSTYKKIQLYENLQEDKSYLYNICLCEGILGYEEGKVEESIKSFQKSTQYLFRAQPYFYISVILVKKNLKEGAGSDVFMKVLSIIEAGLKVGENCQMYYYRGLIYLYLGMNAEAIDDVDKAIQKSQDNVAKYFYLRALIFMHQRNYEQAISEFSTCLSIDEKYFDVYLERAKAKLLCSDIEGAFQDLQSYPMGQEWKPIFYLYQGNYEYLIEQNKGQQNVLSIANFQLGQFDKAGPGGKIVLAIVYKNYEQVVKLLDQALQINFPIGCLQVQDLLILKAYCFYSLGRYEECISMLNKAEQLVSRNENSFSYEDDQKKLLLIKINIIFVTFNNNQISQAISLCKILINDVYEGPIYDELLSLNNFFEKFQSQPISIKFQLFKSCSMISDYFEQQQFKGLKYRFYILFPRVRVLDIQIPQYEQPLLDFNIVDIENRPEAPWMKKDENGVIFTNEIQHFEGLNLQTQENQGDKTEKEKIKESLQLDVEVVNRLQKLSKKLQQDQQ